MGEPQGHSEAPYLLVADTGALKAEVARGASDLPAALADGSARLFVAQHVLDEMERELSEPALTRWRTRYRPHTTVVSVPDVWGEDSPPTARLAAALAPCHELTSTTTEQEDRKPVRVTSLVPAVLVIALTQAASRALGRLPKWAQALLALTGMAGIYWWRHNRPAEAHAETPGTWQADDIAPRPQRTLSEQIARLLATSDEPMTATDMAKRVDLPGPARQKGNTIRTELRQRAAFHEVSRGRWRLGTPAGDDG
ncbi:MAG TPA: hypothetical protein VJX10_10575 [Pseudonocardiaceae bacterium]|nr:hypothetical protein [Pseudonocardiaceae bacterium]